MTVTTGQFDSFFRALGRRRRDSEWGDVERTLGAIWQRAIEKWPNLKVDRADFFASLAPRITRANSIVSGLSALRTSDLYAAFAAVNGDERAVAAIMKQCGPDVRRSLASMRLNPATVDEVLQRLQERLFVSTSRARMRVGAYSGTGSLGAWLAAAATRLAIDLQRASGRDTDPLDERLEAVVAAQGDLEITFLKERYRREFREAFQSSFAELAVDDRNLVRLTFIDGLSIDELSPMLGAHRSTVARRIAKLRDTLAQATRTKLRERFRLTGSEVDSMMRLITSAFDISLSRVLKEPSLPAPTQRSTAP